MYGCVRECVCVCVCVIVCVCVPGPSRTSLVNNSLVYLSELVDLDAQLE